MQPITSPAGKIVSVSLGPSGEGRDHFVDLRPLGLCFSVERRGADGDYDRFAALLSEANKDPRVVGIAFGGINSDLRWRNRRYTFAETQRYFRLVDEKRVYDGTVLKRIWEPYVVKRSLETGLISLRGARVLAASAVDRWGMTEAAIEAGADVAFGDLMFGLGLPVALRRVNTLNTIAKIALPVVCRLPYGWLYPTKPHPPTPKFRRWFDWADVLMGDFRFLKQYMPLEDGSLRGKIIITNSTTEKDLIDLKRRGVEKVVATTPQLAGRTFGTNAMAGLVSAACGVHPDFVSVGHCREVFERCGWSDPVSLV